MDLDDFIVIGENMHCTRICLSDGKKTARLKDGSEAVVFQFAGEDRRLRVPANWGEISPAYKQGKIKHVGLAIRHWLDGESADDRRDGEDYLRMLAETQIRNGAAYLDVNVDEYGTDIEENAKVMRDVVRFLAANFDSPICVDSSNVTILRAGLAAREATSGRRAILNSVSLERIESLELLQEFNADAVVNAAGAEAMPANVEERLANFAVLMGKLDAAGIERGRIYLDPLVLPISTDPMNGNHFLETVEKASASYPGVHLAGGFSNVSFGMPNRKLLNIAFILMAVEKGCDAGIIDPVLTPVEAIKSYDAESNALGMAKAVLSGEDMFGMAFIEAYRAGTL